MVSLRDLEAELIRYFERQDMPVSSHHGEAFLLAGGVKTFEHATDNGTEFLIENDDGEKPRWLRVGRLAEHLLEFMSR